MPYFRTDLLECVNTAVRRETGPSRGWIVGILPNGKDPLALSFLPLLEEIQRTAPATRKKIARPAKNAPKKPAKNAPKSVKDKDKTCKCGKVNPPGSKYCLECGKFLPAPKTRATKSTQDKVSSPAPQVKRAIASGGRGLHTLTVQQVANAGSVLANGLRVVGFYEASHGMDLEPRGDNPEMKKIVAMFPFFFGVVADGSEARVLIYNPKRGEWRTDKPRETSAPALIPLEVYYSIRCDVTIDRDEKALDKKIYKLLADHFNKNWAYARVMRGGVDFKDKVKVQKILKKYERVARTQAFFALTFDLPHQVRDVDLRAEKKRPGRTFTLKHELNLFFVVNEKARVGDLKQKIRAALPTKLLSALEGAQLPPKYAQPAFPEVLPVRFFNSIVVLPYTPATKDKVRRQLWALYHAARCHAGASSTECQQATTDLLAHFDAKFPRENVDDIRQYLKDLAPGK